jgi:hypothetical protein
MSNLRAAATTDLYRHYARDGTLLYVGISLSALARLIQHRRSARWYRKITSVRIKKFPSREAAEAAEKIAIEQEKPLFNIFNSSLERRLAERKEPSGPRWPNIMSFSEWCVLRGFSVSTGRRTLKRVAHEQGAKNANGDVKKVSVRKHMRQKHASTMLSKAAAEARDTLFNLVAENGKKIRDLTGDELDQLESNNIARANLYRELRKQVKGSEVVGDVLDDEKFRAVVNHIGDIKELVGLFE